MSVRNPRNFILEVYEGIFVTSIREEYSVWSADSSMKTVDYGGYRRNNKDGQ